MYAPVEVCFILPPAETIQFTRINISHASELQWISNYLFRRTRNKLREKISLGARYLRNRPMKFGTGSAALCGRILCNRRATICRETDYRWSSFVKTVSISKYRGTTRPRYGYQTIEVPKYRLTTGCSIFNVIPGNRGEIIHLILHTATMIIFFI